MIIATVSDSNYLKFLKPLIKSVSLNSPECSIFCWLINCSTEDELLLKSIHPHVECYHDKCSLSKKRSLLSKDGVLLHEYISTGLEKAIIPGGAKWLTSPFMGYCTNIRFKVINMLLQRGDPVLFLDADAIVRRNISHADITGDISVRTIYHESYDGKTTPKRPLSDPGNTQYQLGVIYAKPTAKAQQFFKDCHELCFEDCEDWDSNIVAFKKALTMHNPHIQPLPRTYKDEGVNGSNTLHSEYVFDVDSHIWSGPGRRKVVNEQYVNEYLKYV